jgi:hypothetical protein
MEEIKQKSKWSKFIDLLGDFFLFLIICLTLILVFALIYLTLELIFENPISLAIICATILVIVGWLK